MRIEDWRCDCAKKALLEELLDQVDVRHDHTAAAVALEAELVHGLTVVIFQSVVRNMSL